MPPSLQKRKAARRKKKNKNDKRSSASSALHNRHGESDGDQHNSPNQVVNMENMEGSSSGYESLTVERTPQDAKEKQAKKEIDERLILTKPDQIEINKAPIIEPGTVADYLSQPFESSPEKGTHEVEDSGFKTPPVGGPVTPVDHSLVEVASKFDNDTKIQEKDDLVAAETSLEHAVINATGSENNELSKENEVQKLDSEINKDSPRSKQDLLQDSTDGKCQHCGRSSNDRVNEPKMPECSERQPLLASAPRPYEKEKASWKNCCGIFELFSGNAR